jgi:branched-chain amino acid transport system ATP-binding protein
MAPMLLQVINVETFYGRIQALFGVSLDIRDGEIVTLLGRNGMGKSTTVKSIIGMNRPRGGEIRFRGERIDGLPSHRIARMGVGLVPEGRRIFPNLTVRENLQMACANRRGVGDPWTVERVLDLFPRLRERLRNQGFQLSGGEQQMLAIGRALVTNPLLLILDEATEGLAPVIRDEIWERLRLLKSAGLSMIVIDKDLTALSEIGDRHFILEKGERVWSGSTAELLSDGSLQDRYLSV